MASEDRLRRMIALITDDSSSVIELPSEDKDILAEFIADNTVFERREVLQGIEVMPEDTTPMTFAYVLIRSTGDWNGMVERARRLRDL